jgi:hypothetical protein
MPAKKPADLIVKHDTKTDQHRREYRQELLTPKQELTNIPPRELTGEIAQALWMETINSYISLDARIVTAFDCGLLIDYCNTCQQLVEIDYLRSTAMSNYNKDESALARVLYSKGNMDLQELLKLINAVNKSLDEVIKLDARADNKRKVIHIFRQSLMLTPRSRGGISPDEKPQEKPQSEMAKIIDGEMKKETKKKKARN